MDTGNCTYMHRRNKTLHNSSHEEFIPSIKNDSLNITTGRRHVGRTGLIEESIKDKPTIIFRTMSGE